MVNLTFLRLLIEFLINFMNNLPWKKTIFKISIAFFVIVRKLVCHNLCILYCGLYCTSSHNLHVMGLIETLNLQSNTTSYGTRVVSKFTFTRIKRQQNCASRFIARMSDIISKQMQTHGNRKKRYKETIGDVYDVSRAEMHTRTNFVEA